MLHLWIKQLDLFGIAENIKTLVNSVEKWRVMLLCAVNSELILSKEKLILSKVYFSRRFFALSPLMFVLSLIPLNKFDFKKDQGSI